MLIPHRGFLAIVITLMLLLDMVPGPSTDFTTGVTRTFFGEIEALGIFLDHRGKPGSDLKLFTLYCAISLHSLVEIKKKKKKSET